MHKHRGFPSRLSGTDYHFLLRRENKKGAVQLKYRERYKDRKSADKLADKMFLMALIEYFGATNFVRGNLDAGRLSWFLGREVIPEDPDRFDPCDYEAVLKLDFDSIVENYPDLQDLAQEVSNE